MKRYPTLYTRNTNGSINIWWAEIDGSAYTTSYGRLEGKIQTALPIFASEKNQGKSNFSSKEEQAILEVEAMYEKRLKQNYFYSVDDIDNAWKEPQLCKLYKDYASKVDWTVGQYVDEKINGVCCLITKNGAKSRKNEVFHSIPHIVEALKPFFEANQEAFLHGELVRRGYLTQLNRTVELISVGRKEKDLTPELLELSKNEIVFVYYDGYGYNGLKETDPFNLRRKEMEDLLSRFEFCEPVNYKICYSEAEMSKFAQDYIQNSGGEGVIVKSPTMSYVHKRSREALKFKKQSDSEYQVIELLEGSGNWAGACKMAVCKLPNGETFRTNVEGSRDYLKEVWDNKDNWVNKYINVRYQELSEYGIPQIPYSDLTIRSEYEG